MHEKVYGDVTMKNSRARKRGQSVLEYSLLIAIVVAALTAMNLYVQRSVKANLKMIENQINDGNQ